jgi:hypothetical protein
MADPERAGHRRARREVEVNAVVMMCLFGATVVDLTRIAVVSTSRRVVELRPGPAQVTGQVVPTHPLLQAPLSGRRCALYQLIGSNHTWPWHDRRSYPPGGARLWIDDGHGQLLVVVPPSAPSLGAMETDRPFQCSIAGEVVRRTIYPGESPETDRLLEPGGLVFRPDAYLDVEERIVAAGDSLTVAGDIIEQIDTDAQSPDFRRPPTRMILRARSLRSATP